MSESLAYLGHARPHTDSPVSVAYWQTELSVETLIRRYAPSASVAHFYKVAGPASIGLRCADCGEERVATSRSDAVVALTTSSPHIDRWGRDRRYRCRPCERVKQVQKLREDGDRRKAEAARVEELRWMPYREYLGTDDWSERRKSVIRRAGFRCQVCASEGRLHVHHRTYVNRGNERPEDMIALCAGCHELFHKHGKLAEGGRAA